MPHAHLATPKSTASTAAKAVVTQIMFRRFDLMTANSPGCSSAFQDTFLRGLICCLVTGFLCAMVISVRNGLRHLERLSLWLPSLTGLGARVRARSQMRSRKRLTGVVSELSTVRIIDELSLQLSAYARFVPVGTKAAGSHRHHLDARGVRGFYETMRPTFATKSELLLQGELCVK
jgi:hypothetical protein